MKKLLVTLFSIAYYTIYSHINAQWNFNFDYSTYGTRVALVSATVSETPAKITINFLDYQDNSGDNIKLYRRALYGNGDDWVLKASITAGTQSWTDTDVKIGDMWEYQVKRNNTSEFGFATGYVAAGLRYDQSDYRGRMILLIDSTYVTSLATEINTLKKDLTGDGWLVEEVYVNRVSGWNGGSSVVWVKNKIIDVYNNAPSGDKPKQLFILGHVPVPRSGLDARSPDWHDEMKGPRGGDCYYADIDGVFTDTKTYNGTYFDNAPGDYQWDQDYIPSELEMAYGRIDFEDLTYFYSESELELLQRYLHKLHNYKHVSKGWEIGGKSAFYKGFDNSTDGAFRSLLPLSGKDSVYEYSGTDAYPLWIQRNGPFMSFWQDEVTPSFSEWETYGMDAILYSSDQSYWGYWDIQHNDASSPSPQVLLATDTKCLSVIWTTTGVNLMHQTGIGECLGLATKQIIDHNTTNQKLEKPEQVFDDTNWWNRTHMQYHGDPTLKLFQVIPDSGLKGSQINSSYKLDWCASTDDNIVGHHVYKSDKEFGKYIRLTDEPIVDTTFIDNTYSGSEWYMVRAVKLQTSGSGTFLNPSQGIFTNVVEGKVGIEYAEVNTEMVVNIYPNPTNGAFTLKLENKDENTRIEVFSTSGIMIYSEIVNSNSEMKINMSSFKSGVYIVFIRNSEIAKCYKLIKQ